MTEFRSEDPSELLHIADTINIVVLLLLLLLLLDRQNKWDVHRDCYRLDTKVDGATCHESVITRYTIQD